MNLTTDMKMKEIIEFGKTVGVKFRPGMKKVDLIELINSTIQPEEETVIEIEEVEVVEVVQDPEESVVIEGQGNGHEQLFWYEYLYRGCSIGAQPKGFVETDESVGKFGAVAYDRELTEYEIESFELKEIMKVEEMSKPVREKAQEIKCYYGGVKGSEENHVQLLHEKIENLKFDLQDNFDDIEYLTAWIVDVQQKNNQDNLVLKLKDVFTDNHIEIVEKHGFEKNRKHFYVSIPLDQEEEDLDMDYLLAQEQSDNKRMFQVESMMGGF